MDLVGLTMICSLAVFADKRHVSEDGQLRAVHLILDFEPLSNTFHDTSQVIKAGDPRLCQIDVSRPGFLA